MTTHKTTARQQAKFKLSFVMLITALLITLPPGPARAAREKPLDLIFKAADSDGDGLISENEWHAAMQKRFNKIDLNADGQISRSELEQSRDTARERFKQLRNSGSGTF